jgi:hypothetical protein
MWSMAPMSEPAGAVAAASETRSRAPLAVVAHLAAGPASAEAAPTNPSDRSRSRQVQGRLVTTPRGRSLPYP